MGEETKEERPGVVTAVYRGRCIECGKPYEGTKKIEPTDSKGFYFAPSDWVHFQVTIEEPVVPAESEEFLNAIAEGMPPELSELYTGALRSQMPSFSMAVDLCPQCLERGVTEVFLPTIRSEFRKVVERTAGEVRDNVMRFPVPKAAAVELARELVPLEEQIVGPDDGGDLRMKVVSVIDGVEVDDQRDMWWGHVGGDDLGRGSICWSNRPWEMPDEKQLHDDAERSCMDKISEAGGTAWTLSIEEHRTLSVGEAFLNDPQDFGGKCWALFNPAKRVGWPSPARKES